MKNIVFLLIIMMLVLPVKVFAVNDKADMLLEGIDTESIYENIPQSAYEDMKEMGADRITIDREKPDLNKLFYKFVSMAGKALRDNRNLYLSFLALFLLHMFISCFSFDDEIKEAVNYFMTLLSVILLTLSFGRFAEESYTVIKDSIKFMYGFVPVFCSLTASSGRVMSANAMGGLILMICEVAGKLTESFFLPFVTSFIVLFLSSALLSSDFLYRTAKLIKNIATALIIFTAGALGFVLTFTNHMASASDSVILKTTGALAGAFVPVIGSYLKDAAGSFRGCMYIISASVGSFGILAGLFIFLPSFIKLLIFKLVLIVFGALSVSFETNETVRLTEGFKAAVTLLLSCQCFMLFILVVSTGIVINSGYGG